MAKDGSFFLYASRVETGKHTQVVMKHVAEVHGRYRKEQTQRVAHGFVSTEATRQMPISVTLDNMSTPSKFF